MRAIRFLIAALFLLPCGGATLGTVTLAGQVNVGGAWTLTVSSSIPNVAVVIRAMQGFAPDQINHGTANVGVTDSAGNWTRSGVFSAGEAGRWIETVWVGGNEVATINFTVR